MPDLPPPIQWMQWITGHWISRAIHVCVKLGLPDVLSSKTARSTAEISEELGLHEGALFRLMRALASLGVFREEAPRAFVITEFGGWLRADHAQSVRGMALFQGSDAHWASWGRLEHCLRTGEQAFSKVHGVGIFEYAEQHPEFSAHFNQAMTDLTITSAPALAGAYDFSGLETVCDVGGGQGYLLSEILTRNPQLRGLLFDLPHVVESAHELLRERGVSDRCEVVGGSFFDELPEADLYLAKHIIHDWGDEKCRQILAKMVERLPVGGRVLLFESVIPPGDGPFFAKFLDLEMLQVTDGGRERTLEEFRALLDSAGLKLERVLPCPNMSSILESCKTG